MKLKFKPTHRILIVANATGHSYQAVEVDVKNGTFHKCDVDAANTKIRVKKGVFAEKLGYNGDKDYNTALSQAEALNIISDFNKRRKELNEERATDNLEAIQPNFYPLEFYRVNENE